MNVYKDAGISIPWRPWMNDPCLRCGRVLAADEYRFADFLGEVIICEACTYRPFVDALDNDGSEGSDE